MAVGVQVYSRGKVRQHDQKSEADGQRQKPAPPGAKVEVNKSQGTHNSNRIDEMRPPDCPPESFWGLRVHRGHLAERKSEYPNHGEEEA